MAHYPSILDQGFPSCTSERYRRASDESEGERALSPSFPFFHALSFVGFVLENCHLEFEPENMNYANQVSVLFKNNKRTNETGGRPVFRVGIEASN